MMKEKNKERQKKIESDTLTLNLLEAKLLNLDLPNQYDPLLQQSGPKLHRLAKICRLGLCNFK
jgi:hypothetical protein